MKAIIKTFVWFILISIHLIPNSSVAKNIKVSGIAHVAYQTSSLERSRAFYTAFTGYEFSFAVSEKREAWYFKVNDQQFVKLIFTPGETKNNKLVEIAWLVDSVEETHAILHDKGLSPSKIKQGMDGTLATAIRDPDNHLIKFIEYTTDSMQKQVAGKHLGARRIAERLISTSFAVTNLTKSIAFYTQQLGLLEHAKGNWPHDPLHKMSKLTLSDNNTSFLELIEVNSVPTNEQFNHLHYATYQTDDVSKVHEETGKFGRPRLEAYAIQQDQHGTPYFSLYCTDGIRLKFTQTSLPLLPE